MKLYLSATELVSLNTRRTGRLIAHQTADITHPRNQSRARENISYFGWDLGKTAVSSLIVLSNAYGGLTLGGHL